MRISAQERALSAGRDLSRPPMHFCYMLSTWQDCCPDTYQRFPGLKRLAELVRARPAIARIAEMNDVGPVAA